MPFTHEHIFDASAAPRGQLPYIVDDGGPVGDSDTIIAHVIRKHRVTMDDGLSGAQRDVSHMVTRLLDDLYWVMSYSRWKDQRYTPAFIAAFRREHPAVTEEGLLKAKEFNAQRYHHQGIGRYSPEGAYARGLDDLQVLANLIPEGGYVHGPKSTSVDAGIYGFIANIYFFDIDAAEAVRDGTSKSRPALHRNPQRYPVKPPRGLGLRSTIVPGIVGRLVPQPRRLAWQSWPMF